MVRRRPLPRSLLTFLSITNLYYDDYSDSDEDTRGPVVSHHLPMAYQCDPYLNVTDRSDDIVMNGAKLALYGDV